MALQDFPDDFQALASIDWGTQLDDAQVADGVVRIKFLPGEGRTAWTAYEKNRVMKALEEFSDVIPIEFQKVNDPRKADFKVSKYADRDDPTLGFMNPPGEELEGVGSFNALGAGWDSKKGKGSTLEKGGYEFYTLIHEFAHGLGLAHPHDDGGESEVMTGVADPEDLGVWDLNQGVYTAMSYNRGLATGEGATTYRFWTYGHQSGPGAIDIAALQMKYGANLTHAAGDDVYVVPDQNRRGTYWETIWDTAGEDEIRYNGTRPAAIDLRAATLTDNPGGGGFLSQSEPARGVPESRLPPPSADESHIQAGGPVDASSFAGVSWRKMGRASFRRSAAALEIASARGDFRSFSTDAWADTESILTKS